MLSSLLYGTAYSLLGIVMLAAGFFALDLLTPGRLGDQIWKQRSTNAAVVLASGFIGLGAIEFTAIWSNAESGFGPALLWTVAFGLLGIALQVVSFLVLDLITPGKLGDVVVEPAFHPAAVVTAASQLAVSAIIVAAIA